MSDPLARVFWLGGATDSGKTTAAQLLATRYGLRIYSYDRSDVAHHERLARNDPSYAEFMNATLDERWVQQSPAALAERAMRSFYDRWPLVLEELLAIPDEVPVLAEGFGLLPDLVAPLLAEKRLAIWLLPSDEFRLASMERRNKPAWRFETSNPELARQNLLERDRLLAEPIREQAARQDVTLYEVDGSLDTEQMAMMLALHYGLEEA